MDYLKEAKVRQEELCKDVSNWVKINSVLDTTTVMENKPFGEGVYNALKYIYDMALKDGFDAKFIDGYCVEINYGSGDEFVLSVGHADVVPVDFGWEKDPFGGEIDDKCIYGRGTSDDKGPVMASYYALKIIKENNIPLKRRIRIVVGGNEETGSKCMDYYFDVYKASHPAYGFTPDADFPLIYGEKGILDYKYSGEMNDSCIEELNGGVVFNSVPETATVLFKRNMYLEASFNKFLLKNKLKGEYVLENNKTRLTIVGKAAHGSTPEEGVNALTYLLDFIAYSTNSELAKHFASRLSSYTGSGLNIDYTGTKMGSLTVNVGVGSYKDNQYSFILNVRYPIDVNKEKMLNNLEKNKLHFGELMDNQDPLYVDKDSEFIQTLLKAYQEISGDYTSKPMTIGGGTYAKHAHNTVAFGMDFPRENNDHGLIHSRNEYVFIESLVKGVAIYTKALVDLANL